MSFLKYLYSQEHLPKVAVRRPGAKTRSKTGLNWQVEISGRRRRHALPRAGGELRGGCHRRTANEAVAIRYRTSANHLPRHNLAVDIGSGQILLVVRVPLPPEVGELVGAVDLALYGLGDVPPLVGVQDRGANHGGRVGRSQRPQAYRRVGEMDARGCDARGRAAAWAVFAVVPPKQDPPEKQVVCWRGPEGHPGH
jgi:hypothetical protein